MALTRLGTNAITSVPSSAITALPAGVGGKVLQQITSVYGTATSTTSSSFVTTNLSASITPSSTSNKILIIFNINSISVNDISTGAGISLFRDSTEIFSTEEYCAYNDGSSVNYSNAGASYLDTPSSTSSINYNLKFKRNLGSGTISIHANNRGSSITLMEIAG